MGRPLDYAAARTTDEAMYARMFHALLDQGVAIAPGAYEVMFPGLAHTEAVVDEIIAAAEQAAAAMQ
jgi:glutamate-1-semialdehyde 2,1-aminomutase